MNKPHKHAALIKAWADGAQIEWRNENDGRWETIRSPSWGSDFQYRIKPEPHKWQHLIDAQAAGKIIQARVCRGEWSAAPGGYRFDDPDMEYRIKPPSVRYRVALMAAGSFTLTVNSDGDRAYVENQGNFVRWLTDWVEVET